MKLTNDIKHDLIECGKEFYAVEESTIITRYKSWNYCHEAFLEAKNNIINNKPVDYDKLSLYLSNYLASWGMSRNSFLLWKDYTVHKEAIKSIILNPKYFPLWDMSINKCDKSLLIDLLDKKSGIREYYKDIKEKAYKELNKIRTEDEAKSLDNEATNTLISKILLGTIGCTPAYDDYLKKAMSYVFKGKRLGSLSANSIYRLCNEEIIKEVILEVRKSIHKKYSKYPDMKILDSCFWQLGYYIKRK